MSITPQTVIEFIDNTGDGIDDDALHVAQEVRINGVHVCVEADSVHFVLGNNNATTVTLTLLPTEIHFIHAHGAR